MQWDVKYYTSIELYFQCHKPLLLKQCDNECYIIFCLENNNFSKLLHTLKHTKYTLWEKSC